MTRTEKIETGAFAAIFIIGLPLLIAAAQIAGS